MRKLTYFKSLLFVALLGATLGACHSDELATREVREPEAVEVKADSFSLKLDFPSVNFDSKITAVSDDAAGEGNVSDDAAGEGKSTRASLAVQNNGTTDIDLSTDGTTAMTVLLILRNQDGSKVYVSPNNQWNLVSGQRTKVEASGIYTFTGVKGATGAPTWKKDDVWFLDAMTGGEWDDKTKAYIINKSCRIPNKMFNPGEKLVLGRDITVPFQLGTDEVGNAGERKWGVRMAVANNDRESVGGFAPRLICIDSEPNFLPYGSLLCMRFKNDLHNINKNLAGAVTDVEYNRFTWRNSYSYFLRGISIESSTSTTGGWIQVSSLEAPNREPLQWHGLKPDGGAYNFVYQSDPTFLVSTQFANASPTNLSTGYPLFRPNKDNVDSDPTPFYYVWVKSIDESRDNALYSSFGLHVRLNLYNATLNQYGLGDRTAFVSNKNHKTGRAYFRYEKLHGSLIPTPLAFFAPDLAYANNDYGGAITWPDSTLSNTAMSTSRYKLSELQSYFGGEFPVNSNPKVHGVPTATNLKWRVPDKYTVSSVFPPPLDGINIGGRALKEKITEKTEDVRIGGVLYKGVKSYYYRHDQYIDNHSNEEKGYNSYFALRFVGTPFCEAVRYTEYGKWNFAKTGGATPPTAVSDSSRFVIHTRHLGNVGINIPNKDAAHAFLSKTVATSRPPYNSKIAPYNDFWGDFWNPPVQKGISMRIYHVGGSNTAISGTTPSRDPRQGYFIGTMFQFAVHNGYYNGNNQFGSYQFNASGSVQRSYTWSYPYDEGNWFLARKNGAMSVLPVLSSTEFVDPASVDAARPNR